MMALIHTRRVEVMRIPSLLKAACKIEEQLTTLQLGDVHLPSLGIRTHRELLDGQRILRWCGRKLLLSESFLGHLQILLDSLQLPVYLELFGGWLRQLYGLPFSFFLVTLALDFDEFGTVDLHYAVGRKIASFVDASGR